MPSQSDIDLLDQAYNQISKPKPTASPQSQQSNDDLVNQAFDQIQGGTASGAAARLGRVSPSPSSLPLPSPSASPSPTPPAALAPHTAEAIKSASTSLGDLGLFNEGMNNLAAPTSLFQKESWVPDTDAFPGVFTPAYHPERVIGGETDVSPAWPMQGPPHKAANVEAAAMNLMNGFISGASSAKGLVGFLPPIFIEETVRSLPELWHSLKEADRTPAWSQERWEAGLAVVATLATMGFMGKAAVNTLRRARIAATTAPPAPNRLRFEPAPYVEPAAMEQPGPAGFTTYPGNIPGFTRVVPPSGVGSVGPVIEQEVPSAEQPSHAQVPPGKTEVGGTEGTSGAGAGPGDSDNVVGAPQGKEAGRQVPQVAPRAQAPRVEEKKQEKAPEVVLEPADGLVEIHGTPASGNFKDVTPEYFNGPEMKESLLPVDAPDGGIQLKPELKDIDGFKVGDKHFVIDKDYLLGAEVAPGSDPVKLGIARENMTRTQLEKEIDKATKALGEGTGSFKAANELLQELKKRQAEQMKSKEAQVPAADINQQPISELLSPQDLAEYQKLSDKIGELDVEGTQLVKDPHNPRAWQIASEQGAIRKRMYQIEDKLPDGDVYDIIQIGRGATGTNAGLHGGVEDMKTIVLEKAGGTGAASAETPQYANVPGPASPLGQAGSTRDLMGELQAKRMGTEFLTVKDIKSYSTDPATQITTITTEGSGKGGAGGRTIRGRIITFGTGSRPRNAPFPLVDSKGETIPFTNLAEPGKTIHLDSAQGMRREAAGGDMGAIGAANSSFQGAEGVAGAPNTGVFHIFNRGDKLKSVSPYLLRPVRQLVNRGRIKVHNDSVVDHVVAPDQPGGDYKIVVKSFKALAAAKKAGKSADTVPVKEEIPVKAVGSFIGSNPNTTTLPKNFIRDERGFIRTTEDLRPLEKDAVGDEVPVPNMFVGGSVRSAPGVNRMSTAEGEGSRMIALAVGEDMVRLEKQGLLPRWKTELRESLQDLGDISAGGRAPRTTYPLMPGVAKEVVREPGRSDVPVSESGIPSLPGGKGPPKKLSPEAKRKLGEGSRAAAEHAAHQAASDATTSAQQQQQDRKVFRKFYSPELLEEQAQKKVETNPLYPDTLLKKMGSGELGIPTPIDSTVILNDRATKQAQMKATGHRAMDKSLPDGERSEAMAAYTSLDNQIRMMEEVTDDGRMLTGDAARAWHNFRMQDYSLPSMATKLEIAQGGKPLSAAQSKMLASQTDKLASASAQVQAMKTRIGWRIGKEMTPSQRKALRDIQFQAHQAKVALDNDIFQARFAQRSAMYRYLARTAQTFDLFRAVMTSGDLSAVLRQGGLIARGHPIMAMKEIPDMLRAAKSDRAYFDLMQDIRERPNAELYVSSKLGLTDVKSPEFSRLEEAYASEWADRIPIVGHSQRAYVYFLNRMRADMFDRMANTLPVNGVPSPAQAEAISQFVNTFTGRGRTPQALAGSMHLMNEVFFAPRWTISRFEVLYGDPIWAAKNAPGVRAMIAKEYARTLIGYGVQYALAYYALKEMDGTVELDPRSSNFGAIRIGDTRWNPLAGLTQPIVLLARLGATAVEPLGWTEGGYKDQQGRIKSLRNPKYGQKGVSDVIQEFTRSKLAPMPSLIWNGLQGEKVTGEPTTWTKELLGLMYPITFGDIGRAIQTFGLPIGAGLALMALFGDSVNTYATKPPRQKKPHPKGRHH